jgi:pre-60S factor REI1
MHLPSGRIAGHRSLRKYYRQNLHSYPTAAERMERAQRLIEEANSEDAEMQDGETNNDVPATQPRNSLMRRGEAGMLGVTAQQRKDVRSQEIRSKQNEQRAQSRYLARLEKQNNFQKHFRVSVFNDVFAEGLFANFCAFRILCFSEWSLSVVLVDMQASRLWKASLFLWA